MQNLTAEVINFFISQLQQTQPLDDSRELLELGILFLGGVPPRGFYIIKSAALHRASFMAKLIYVYKIFLSRHSYFKLTKRELKGLADLCIFKVQIYVKSWFSSQLSTAAPVNGLNLLKILSLLDTQAAKGALKKLCGHLRYLSEELIALSFFDRNIIPDEKRLMVAALQKPALEDPPKRVTVDIMSMMCSYTIL